jgi:DNA polymerase III subunit epsilon
VDYNYLIVSMTRGATKESKSPMWRCVTAEGEKVNVFSHNDPAKNNALLFKEAGYLNEMLALVDGEELIWREHPIAVALKRTPDGKWWDVVGVGNRPADAQPDPKFKPDPLLHRQGAAMWADDVLDPTADVVILDLETTGVSSDDEILSIAIINNTGETLLESYVKPANIARAAATESIHGITADLLEHASSFDDIYMDIQAALLGRVCVVWNADFDIPLLQKTCVRAGLPPIVPLGTACAMKMFAEWHGEWNAKHQHYTSKSLVFAAQCFDLDTSHAHDALADCRLTLGVIRGMAKDLE